MAKARKGATHEHFAYFRKKVDEKEAWVKGEQAEYSALKEGLSKAVKEAEEALKSLDVDKAVQSAKRVIAEEDRFSQLALRAKRVIERCNEIAATRSKLEDLLTDAQRLAYNKSFEDVFPLLEQVLRNTDSAYATQTEKAVQASNTYAIDALEYYIAEAKRYAKGGSFDKALKLLGKVDDGWNIYTPAQKEKAVGVKEEIDAEKNRIEARLKKSLEDAEEALSELNIDKASDIAKAVESEAKSHIFQRGLHGHWRKS